VENSFILEFWIPKIGDVCACSTTTMGHMAEWMERRDSASQIGLVRHPPRLAICSGIISMWRILLSWNSEFRKLVMFVPVAPQP